MVPVFANSILGPIGRPIGNRSKVTCRTEVVFKSNKELRPDGLITVDSSRTNWNAIVEFKVGGVLETPQVENYLKLARANKVNAVITISNDLAPDPNSSPIKVDKRLIRSVELYHFSWMYIFTQAELLLQEDAVKDGAQRFILQEFARFLVHKSTGIKGYESMPEVWPELVQKVRDKAKLSSRDICLIDSVDGWIQEERELSLILSRQTGVNCCVKRKRGVTGIDKIREGHLKTLVDQSMLSASIQIPNAASDLDVLCNLPSRSIFVQMNIKAPKDRKRHTSSLNWLLKQLTEVTDTDITIRVNWPSRVASTEEKLDVLRMAPEGILFERQGLLPNSFDVIFRKELNANFNSRKKIITILESMVSEFYREAGSLLTAWVAKAPVSRDKTTTEELVDKASFNDESDSAAE